MGVVKAVLAVLIFFLALTFSLQNNTEVQIQYWGLAEGLRVRLYVAILVSFFAGVLVGGFGGFLSNLRLKWELRRARKDLERLKKEKPPSYLP